MDARLRPVERIRTSSEFRRVFQRGRTYRSAAMRIVYLPTDREFSRVGLVVSRKRGKAHDRTRIKRLLRETFRLHKNTLPRSFDVVFIPEGRGARPLAEYVDGFTRLAADLERRASGTSASPACEVAAGRSSRPARTG